MEGNSALPKFTDINKVRKRLQDTTGEATPRKINLPTFKSKLQSLGNDHVVPHQ